MKTNMLSLFVIIGILMAGSISGQQFVFADSDELKIEIKIKNGVAEIEVKFDDDKYEFKLATSNINEILEITSLRTGISTDLLEDAMKLEVKDKHDDERNEDDDHDEEANTNDNSNDLRTETLEKKLRASTLGDSSEVKIELEFITDTTDSEFLIDEILENFIVTQKEAEDSLKIQEEDDDELEEKFNVEIEIKNGISEVEVELRYVLDSTSRDDIILSIIEQSHLDAEFLASAIDVRPEFDDDSFDGISDTTEDMTDVTLDSDEIINDSDEIINDSELKELRVENDNLRQENQVLREKNNDLQEQLANLNNILMEQIRVIMDTLATLRS